MDIKELIEIRERLIGPIERDEMSIPIWIFSVFCCVMLIVIVILIDYWR